MIDKRYVEVARGDSDKIGDVIFDISTDDENAKFILFQLK